MLRKSTDFKKIPVGLCTLLLCLLLLSGAASAEGQLADTEILGTLSYSLSTSNHSGAQSDDSSLGYAVADAVCVATGCDIAIVNGGDLAEITLAVGEVTQSDILACFAEDRQLATAEITPKQLYALLEAGVSHITLDMDTAELLHSESEFGGFPQVSGFQFQYDASAPAGERVMWVKVNGDRLDPEDEETTISLAGTAYLLSGGYESPAVAYTPLELTLSEAFAKYVADGIGTNYASVDRMTVVGCNEYRIINNIPVTVLVAIVVIFGGMGLMRERRRRKTGDYDWDEREDG